VSYSHERNPQSGSSFTRSADTQDPQVTFPIEDAETSREPSHAISCPSNWRPDATMSSDRLLGDRDGVINTCNPRGFFSDLLRGLPHEAGAHFAGQVHDVIKGLNID
jgi:hypothetical protein